MTKRCARCGETKNLTEFSKSKKNKDGWQSYCRDCAVINNRRWRSENRDRLNARCRERKRNEIVKKGAAYQARHRALHPDRQRCRNRVTKALFNGSLKRQPCTICNTTKDIQAHHPDYSDWKKITWLCGFHHRELHNAMRKEDESPRRDANLTSHLSAVSRLGDD